jgi:hypothetical protein
MRGLSKESAYLGRKPSFSRAQLDKIRGMIAQGANRRPVHRLDAAQDARLSFAEARQGLAGRYGADAQSIETMIPG